MSLKRHSSILNGDIVVVFFLFFCIIINKMKQQITENEGVCFFFRKNCPGVSSDLKYS